MLAQFVPTLWVLPRLERFREESLKSNIPGINKYSSVIKKVSYICMQ